MQGGKKPQWIRHNSDNSSPLEQSIDLVCVHIEEGLVVLKSPERGTFLLSCKQLVGKAIWKGLQAHSLCISSSFTQPSHGFGTQTEENLNRVVLPMDYVMVSFPYPTSVGSQSLISL